MNSSTRAGWETITINGKNHAAQVIECGNNRFGVLLMEEFIVNCPFDCHVEHRDGDALNNQRNNLKLCKGTLPMDSIELDGLPKVGILKVTRMKDRDTCNYYLVELNQAEKQCPIL